MVIVIWVLALLAAAAHVLAFIWESLVFHRPGVHGGVFGTPSQDVPALRLWTFGLGFYNLFLGLGNVIGVVLWAKGDVVVGQTLVIYVCTFMFLCAIVLLVADQLAMGRPRGSGLGGVLGQGVLPLLALVLMLF